MKSHNMDPAAPKHFISASVLLMRKCARLNFIINSDRLTYSSQLFTVLGFLGAEAHNIRATSISESIIILLYSIMV